MTSVEAIDMQHRDDAQECEQPKIHHTSTSRSVPGKESIIADYCRNRITLEKKACIWLCIKRRRKYNLVDIPLEQNEQEIGLQSIRKRLGWWKRYSLYSVVAVKEKKVRILAFDKATNRISAAVRPFDCTDDISRLVEYKAKIQDRCIESEECGVNINGQRHDTNLCDNAAWDQVAEEASCELRRQDELELKHDEYRWLTSFLEYFWQNGIDKKGREFLLATGFVTSYDALIYDQWFDARRSYGKTIKAFLVVEGWNITLLLQLIGIGVFLTICVVSVVTAACHNIEIGLTVGSYALGLLTILLATFSFLSAVI